MLVMHNENNIKSYYLADIADHKIYILYMLLDIILPIAICYQGPKIWIIYSVLHSLLYQPFVSSNRYFDVNTILKISHTVEYTPKYDIGKAISSIQ
jgi:hypothetical protein